MKLNYTKQTPKQKTSPIPNKSTETPHFMSVRRSQNNFGSFFQNAKKNQVTTKPNNPTSPDASYKMEELFNQRRSNVTHSFNGFNAIKDNNKNIISKFQKIISESLQRNAEKKSSRSNYIVKPGDNIKELLSTQKEEVRFNSQKTVNPQIKVDREQRRKLIEPRVLSADPTSTSLNARESPISHGEWINGKWKQSLLSQVNSLIQSTNSIKKETTPPVSDNKSSLNFKKYIFSDQNPFLMKTYSVLSQNELSTNQFSYSQNPLIKTRVISNNNSFQKDPDESKQPGELQNLYMRVQKVLELNKQKEKKWDEERTNLLFQLKEAQIEIAKLKNLQLNSKNNSTLEDLDKQIDFNEQSFG